MSNANPPGGDQVDTLDEALATYHSDSCPAETEFQEFFTPNLVKYCDCRVKKLKAKLSALLVEVELKQAVWWSDQATQMLVAHTHHQHDRFDVINKGMADRIKELQQGASQ